MARFKDQNVVRAAFRSHLEPGEVIRYLAYGVRQPPIAVVLPLYLMGILPGVIAVALMTREYVVALTDRRFIALRFKGDAIKVEEVLVWSLDALPPVRASTGGLFTHIAIRDQARPFTAKFHRSGMPGQREEAMAMQAALARSTAG